jgi:hypothetical protein
MSREKIKDLKIKFFILSPLFLLGYITTCIINSLVGPFFTNIYLLCSFILAFIISIFSDNCVRFNYNITSISSIKEARKRFILKMFYIFCFPISALFIKEHEPILSMFGNDKYIKEYAVLIIWITLPLRIIWFLGMLIVFVYKNTSCELTECYKRP